VGYGVVQWDKVVPILATADVITYLVEHDNPSDYVRFARRSYETVEGWEAD
jgi:hypothetical protein